MNKIPELLIQRCPFCNLAPVITAAPCGCWKGGCQTRNGACEGIADIIWQTTYEAAVRQWNHVVGIGEDVLRKVA